MKFSRYLQDVPQTDDDKVEMYNKCSIEELAKMHVELEKHFNRLLSDIKNDNVKDLLEWSLKRYQNSYHRYMSDERFLVKYLNLNFFKRLFLGRRKINEHLRKMLIKYNF